MNMIYTLANALAEANGRKIARLDLQYNYKTLSYSGRLWLLNNLEDANIIYDIREDGTVERIKEVNLFI